MTEAPAPVQLRFCLPTTTAASPAAVQPQDLRFYSGEACIYAHRAVLTQFGCAWLARLIEMDADDGSAPEQKRQRVEPAAKESVVAVAVAAEDWPAFQLFGQAHYGPLALAPEQLAGLAEFVAKIEHDVGKDALRNALQEQAGGELLAAVAARLLPLWAAAPDTFFLAEELRTYLRTGPRTVLKLLPAEHRHPFATLCLQEMQRCLPSRKEAQRLFLELLLPQQLIALRQSPLYPLLSAKRVQAALEFTVLASQQHRETFTQTFPHEGAPPVHRCQQGTQFRLSSANGVQLDFVVIEPNLALVPLRVTMRLGESEPSFFTRAFVPTGIATARHACFFTGPGPHTVQCTVEFLSLSSPVLGDIPWPRT